MSKSESQDPKQHLMPPPDYARMLVEREDETNGLLRKLVEQGEWRQAYLERKEKENSEKDKSGIVDYRLTTNDVPVDLLIALIAWFAVKPNDQKLRMQQLQLAEGAARYLHDMLQQRGLIL